MTTLLLAAVDAAAVSMDFGQAEAAGTSLQTLTLYLFFAGTVAMGAGALYFFLLRNDVDPEYRSTMVVAGLVCAIACFHYYKMTHVYQESGGQFPTALRYIDWLFTTPLLLLKFPLLLRLGDRGICRRPRRTVHVQRQTHHQHIGFLLGHQRGDAPVVGPTVARALQDEQRRRNGARTVGDRHADALRPEVDAERPPNRQWHPGQYATPRRDPRGSCHQRWRCRPCRRHHIRE